MSKQCDRVGVRKRLTTKRVSELEDEVKLRAAVAMRRTVDERMSKKDQSG